MVFVCESTVLEVTILFLCFIWLIYLLMTSKYKYWKDRNIAYVEPHFPFGTHSKIVFSQINQGCYYQNIYTSFRNEKFVGLFELNKPYLLVRDIEIAKLMMTKDFQHFINRGIVNLHLLSALNINLFIMEGKKWKYMRSKLSPAFTSGKIKLMFQLVEACSKELIGLLTLLANQDENIDVRDIVSRYTMDVVASCGFGLESNTIRDPSSEFMINGSKLCAPIHYTEMIKYVISVIFPRLSKMARIKLSEHLPFDFFISIVKQTISYREKQNIVRNDFIDHLIRVRGDKTVTRSCDDVTPLPGEEVGVSCDEIVAQVTVFFAAALNNTVQAITFCLYEITNNKDIQSTLRKEINEVLCKHSGVMSYEAIQGMPYLEAVICETLRRYPTISMLNRICNEDYKVPGTDLVIEKGTKIVIPTYSFHHDADYFPEPYKFCPERFMDSSVKHAAYLPFGEGPRHCIAAMFTMLIMKLCVAEIVRNFQLFTSEHTPLDVVLSAKHFYTTAQTPILLKFSKHDSKQQINS